MEPDIIGMSNTQDKQLFTEKKHATGWDEIPELSVTCEILQGTDQTLGKSLEQLRERLDWIEKYLKEFQPPKNVKPAINTEKKTDLETVRHYVNIGKIAGQVIETIAIGAIAILDSIRSGKNVSPSPEAPAKSQAPADEVDLSSVIHSLSDLIMGVMSSIKSDDKTPPAEKR